MLTRRTIAFTALKVLGAWAVPFAAHAAGADFLLPVLVWLWLAALLRGGRTLLDRLVLSAAALYSAVCVLWLVPLPMHPVPVAGMALTALALVPRAPRLPWKRVPAGDWGIVAAVAAGAAFTVSPFAGKGFRGLLEAFFAEDFSRHFVMFDSIRRFGGYLFYHSAETYPYLTAWLHYQSYPQGSHLVSALAANFVQGTTDPGPGMAALNIYIWLHVAGWLLFLLVMLWAARWIARATGWTSLTLTALLTIFILYGEPVIVLMMSFPSEISGLTMVAMLTALCVRPLHRTREQIVLVGLLVTAVALTYYLFLPLAGLIALAWLVVYRRHVLRHRLLAAVVMLGTAAGSAVLPLIAVFGAPVGDNLNLPGSSLTGSRVPVLVVLGLTLLGIVASWRDRVWRSMALAAGIAVLATAALAVYQLSTVGRTIYYFEKMWHQATVVVLVGTGAFVALIVRNRFRYVTGLVVVAVAFVVMAAPKMPGVHSWGKRYKSPNRVDGTGAALVIAALNRWPQADGRVVLAVSAEKESGFNATLYSGTLQHQYPVAANLAYGQPWYLGVRDEQGYRELLRTYPIWLRVVTDQQWMADLTTQVQKEQPDRGIELLFTRTS
ncbi:hypothetical protein [Longispora albida]|uniref:hypothetical protein n=1 Tax=Longispora albida TaxID=203523 RepID=UPI00037EE5F7|nr:hypothetical protein [Longispora albida]